ncbi:hypothetical protein B0H14DRAFT_2610567 [Mycena olivaceomarginata]|nr:hypothetical protein B0H14DRAFT_2610567 [Mycena olivaceomarginata]
MGRTDREKGKGERLLTVGRGKGRGMKVVERPGEKRGEKKGMERKDGGEEQVNARANTNRATAERFAFAGWARIRPTPRSHPAPTAPHPPRLPPSRNRIGARPEAPSSPWRLSISPPLVAGLGHGGDAGVRPGEREAGKKNDVVGLERPRRKEEEGRKSREERMGSSVSILSSVADVAAVRSGESPRG